MNKAEIPKTKEKSKTKYQERTGELTENEKLVLDNLRGTVKWLEDYRVKRFGIDENMASRNADLGRYFQNFHSEFESFEKPSEEQEILAEAKKAEIIFLGDYHNLRKSQEFAAEFLGKTQKNLSEPAVLAVEFVSPKNQKILDEFMAGVTSEDDFFRKIHFSDWDDPEHQVGYKKLLETARRLGIKVYGIKFSAKGKLQKERDLVFAESLQRIRTKNPKAKVFVHIGDVHLASAHLPETLSRLPEFKQQKTLKILQNVKSLYFSALKKYQDFEVPKAVKIKEGAYNFFTAPIITELVSDIENLKFLRGDAEGEDIWSDGLAPEIIARLRGILGIKIMEKIAKGVPPSYFFPSFYSEEESVGALAELKEELPEDVFRQYMKTLNEKGCVFIPRAGSDPKKGFLSNRVIIKRFRLKRIIEELAKFVIDPKGEKGDISALQYFCSKLFIPERQPEDLKEVAGEKIFRDFLRGKSPTLPH